MKPINDQMNNFNRGSSNGGKKSHLGIIIFIIIVIIYFVCSGDDEYTPENDNTNTIASNDYYEDEAYDYSRPSEYANDDSLSLFDLLFGDVSTSNSNQDYSSYHDSSIKNTSQERYTLMIYMCGSNLESDGGYASDDIEEMLKSSLADEINLLIYTGGSKRWYDYGISSKTNQIYQVKNHQLNTIENDFGKKSMAEPATLLEFLLYGKEHYEADKYGLVFWDHGGGAVTGFALDEAFAKKDDTLTIDEIRAAVERSGIKFEFIGFDACLMANFETAYALKDYANYLIASEETEPGDGWEYQKVLNSLSKDTSQEGNVTGKTIVDSFISTNTGFRNPDATLSVTDLSKMNQVYTDLVAFLKDIKKSNFDKNNYSSFARALQQTKQFADGENDSVDLVNFAENIKVSSGSKLINSVKNAVYYNKTNQYVKNSNGLSIFIPNKKLDYYSQMLKIYNNIGIGSEYTSVLSQYVNLKAGGHRGSYEVRGYKYTEPEVDYSSYDWYDSNFVSSHQDYYNNTSFDKDELKVVERDGQYVLDLSDEEWDKIVDVASVLWYDDGNGYVDMGVDSYFELDDEGDLIISSDGTWIAINGQNVVYEVLERTEDYEKGRVPAVVNGERVNLILYFDEKNPEGVVLGYQPDYANEQVVIFEKGLRKFRIGDTIDFVACYFEYNGDFKEEYYIGDTITIGKEPLKVSYEYLGEGDIMLYYKLTDIYDNTYYTEAVILEE